MRSLKDLINKQKVVSATLSTPVRAADEHQNDPNVYVKCTPRDLFTSPIGHCYIVMDYSSQEMLTAAALSGDEILFTPFSQQTPKMLTREVDGQTIEYPNPYRDSHIITTARCCFPELFDGKELWEWKAIGDDASLVTYVKSTPRKIGKITNYGIQYMQTAKAMANLNFLKEEICEKWIKGHEKTYTQFHFWAKRISTLATARGWNVNNDGRVRWCAESNSKGVEEGSTGRMAVNSSIQGPSASQIKKALVNLARHFANTPVRICAMIHDEVILEVPCTYKIESIYDEKGNYKPVLTFNQQVYQWAEEARKCMTDAQEYYFRPLAIARGLDPDTYKGLADVNIGLYWTH